MVGEGRAASGQGGAGWRHIYDGTGNGSDFLRLPACLPAVITGWDDSPSPPLLCLPRLRGTIEKGALRTNDGRLLRIIVTVTDVNVGFSKN